MTGAVITVAFVVGAIVLLVVLWRRGPEQRGAFFLAGLLMVGIALVLSAVMDDLERGIDGWFEEQRERHTVGLPAGLEEATGVSVSFPETWEVEETDQERFSWLYPPFGSDLRWDSLALAAHDADTCHLVDATEYAEALGFWRVDAALAHEVEALESVDPESPLGAYRALAAEGSRESLSTGFEELPAGHAAVIDEEMDQGWPARHYLINQHGRWIYLSCESPHEAPESLWTGIASSIEIRPLPSRPSEASEAPAGPSGQASPALDPPFDTCRTLPLGDVPGAVAATTCAVERDVGVTYARFPDMAALDEWWAQTSAGTRTFPTATAVSRCQSGASAEAVRSSARADGPDGRFMCQSAWVRSWGWGASVSWTDTERLVGASVIGESSSLPILYERWSQGEFDPRAESAPVPGPTPIPPDASLRQTEAALRDLAPFEDCRERFNVLAPGSKVVITCQADDDLEVTYAQFADRGQLEDWWRTETAGITAASETEVAQRCQAGQRAEGPHPGGRLQCQERGIHSRISWLDGNRLIGAIATSASIALPDLYERWESGEFEPGATPRPIESTPSPSPTPLRTSTPTVHPTSTPEPTAASSPTPAEARFGGIFTDDWVVERADPDDHFWLYPEADEELAWTPVFWATDGKDECALIDASEYADELVFWEVADAVEWELDYFGDDPEYPALPRIAWEVSLIVIGDATGEVMEWSLEDLGRVDVETAGGRLERTYIFADGSRWAYLNCRSSDPPDDHWLSLALALQRRPLDRALQPLPTPTPTLAPTPVPTAGPCEDRLCGVVPLEVCESRPARKVAGASAVIRCDGEPGIDVDYMRFESSAALDAWWERQGGSVGSVSAAEAAHACRSGESAESTWHLDPLGPPQGHVLCRPQTNVRRPVVAWTEEARLIGGRVTSTDHDLRQLYERWEDGDYRLDQR